MKKQNDDIEQLEKKENRAIHVILITSLTALLLVSFLGFGYGIGAVKVVDIMQQHLVDYEKGNTTEEKTKEDKLDINSRVVQLLYHEVAFDMNKSEHMWQYDDKNEDTVAMNVVGMNLNANKAHYADNAPAYEGYEKGLIQGEGAKYFTKAEVESVYRLIYGKDAAIDTSKDINVGKDGLSVYHYDNASEKYYSYHKNGGHVSGPAAENGKLDKAVADGSRVNIYQRVNYVDESDSSKNTKYYYVYHFEKESDGMYKFINRTKEAI